jgi:hypothetical protein
VLPLIEWLQVLTQTPTLARPNLHSKQMCVLVSASLRGSLRRLVAWP